MHTSRVHFHRNIRHALADDALAKALAGIKGNFVGKRARAVASYNDTADFESLRQYAKEVRDAGIAQMPALLQQFSERAAAHGTTVLWAKDADRACALIREIAARHQVKLAVKSKSMASEEVHLNSALAEDGVEVVETDLGEFIIQLSGETPSHIIAPAVHKTRAQVSALFKQHLAVDTSDIAALTAAARAHLREKFLAADMGISGANFLAADTGAAVIVTNEGNGRMTTTLPRVHVTLAGIDKIIPRAADIPHLLLLLAQSATGQRLSNYMSMTAGNRRRNAHGASEGAGEGPEYTYIVLLDNGRSRLRQSAYREMLRCIRCGACMNHCPVYQQIGGHAYGSVYMGPMGQVLTPALWGVERAGALPYAATLCGACEVVCPVKIPLPKLMRRLRAERVRKNLSAPLDKLFIRVWGFCARRPAVYALLTAVAVRLGAWLGGRQRRLRKLPGVPGMGGWFAGRDLPAPPPRTFRQIWRQMQREEKR